jgi:hypothetical protein
MSTLIALARRVRLVAVNVAAEDRPGFDERKPLA